MVSVGTIVWLSSELMFFAALFAIMTKVGAYAIIRIHAVVFGPDVAVLDGLIGDWLMPAALVTLAFGAIGVMGARRLMSLLSFSVIASMGTMMIAVAAFTPYATGAAGPEDALMLMHRDGRRWREIRP